MSFREAVPPEPPTWTPQGDFRSPDPLCPPHLQILATPLFVVGAKLAVQSQHDTDSCYQSISQSINQ